MQVVLHLQPHSQLVTSQTGSAATIEDGVIYIRGQFVKVNRQTLLLSANSNTETTRVGLTVTETLITPEVDTTLTDNARGSSNYAAKGAHRLKDYFNTC